jgi:ATP-dependent RNA helicase DDX31/DBP7
LYSCSILEFGFGKALEDILEHLGSRSGAPDQNKSKMQSMHRQNLLLSATLNEKVNRLAKISLKNPVMIGLDDQKKQSNTLGNNHTSLLSDDEEDEILERKNDLVEHGHDDYKLPTQLVQRYVKGSSSSLKTILKFMLVTFCADGNKALLLFSFMWFEAYSSSYHSQISI